MATWPAIGAADNAAWCDVMCRTHGARTQFGADAWTSWTRTPTYYPDAATVLAGGTVARVVAGAILHRRAGVVGISNVFTASRFLAETWSGIVTVADGLFPGLPLVGYESGEMLAAACDQGFETAGPLRVWLKEP